jgi:hypothetical protein
MRLNKRSPAKRKRQEPVLPLRRYRIATYETSLTICYVNSLEEAKQKVVWGTYGKGGVEHCYGRCPEHQLRWVRLIDCSTEHLLALLKFFSFEDDYSKIINSILDDRGVKR